MVETLEEVNDVLSADERVNKKKEELRRIMYCLRNVPVSGAIPNVYAEAALLYAMVKESDMGLPAVFYLTGKLMTTIRDTEGGWFSYGHSEYSQEFVKEFAELLGDDVDVDRICLIIDSIDSYINLHKFNAQDSHALMMKLSNPDVLEAVHYISESLEGLEETFETLNKKQRKDIYRDFRNFIRQYTK